MLPAVADLFFVPAIAPTLDAAGLDAVRLDTVRRVVELLAVAVFAVTGALVASRKQMDIFGFAMLATTVGIGGGTVRDVLLGRYPLFWITDPSYVVVCVVVSAIVYFTAHLLDSRYRALLWFDAIGLSLVAVAGAEKGLVESNSVVVALVMAVITGSFGGIIRDILAGEVPLVLQREVYVTAALAGGLAYVLAHAAGLPRGAAMGLGALVCFAVRGSAIHYGWSVGSYRPRPGRTLAEIERARDNKPPQ